MEGESEKRYCRRVPLRMVATPFDLCRVRQRVLRHVVIADLHGYSFFQTLKKFRQTGAGGGEYRVVNTIFSPWFKVELKPKVERCVGRIGGVVEEGDDDDDMALWGRSCSRFQTWNFLFAIEEDHTEPPRRDWQKFAGLNACAKKIRGVIGSPPLPWLVSEPALL